MKNCLFILIALALLFACSPQDNGSHIGKGNDSDGLNNVTVTAIKLNKNELSLEKGENEVLSVTFTPSNATNQNVTWVSSNKSIAEVTDGIVVGVATGNTEIIAKCDNATDKCQVYVVSHATSISVSQKELILDIKDEVTLTAAVLPEDCTDRVEWSSSNETVAIVKDGIVSAQAEGEAIITASAGTQTSACRVVVNSSIPTGAVDLGIVITREDGSSYNLYWAKSNLCTRGLSPTPEDSGDYYAWGEIEPYYEDGHSHDRDHWKEGKQYGYDWYSYRWCNYAEDGTFYRAHFTKYFIDGRDQILSQYYEYIWGGNGDADNLSLLELSDDAAHATLGGKWRIPTVEEWNVLLAKTTLRWETHNGMNGCLVTGNNGNSIFIPASGYRTWSKDDDLRTIGEEGCYWSPSLDVEYPQAAISINVSSSGIKRWSNPGDGFQGGTCRYVGMTIRPVSE